MPETPTADPILGLRFLPDWLKEDAPAKSFYSDDDTRGDDNDGEREFRRGGRSRRDHTSQGRNDRGRTGGPPRGRDARSGGGQRGPRTGSGSGGDTRQKSFGGAQRENRGRSDHEDKPRVGGAREGRRENRRDFDRQPSAPTVEPAPVDVTFLPPPAMAEAILRQIKGTFLAYPLFRISKLFLEQPDRHMVRLTMREGSLFQSRLGGPVSSSPDSLARSLFEARGDDFYQVVVEDGEEIKGNFTRVAKCGLSGEILGPPNHHSYQNAIRTLYSQRFANRMSFENYRARISIVTDPELVEQWKTSSRQREKFVFKGVDALLASTPATSPESAASPTSSHAPEPTDSLPVVGEDVAETTTSTDESIAPEPRAIANEAPTPEQSAETPAPAASIAPPLSEAQSETAATPDVDKSAADIVTNTPASGHESVDNSATSNASVGAAPIGPKALVFESREDAFRHFQTEIIPQLVTEITTTELYGKDAKAIDDPAIREALHLAWENEMRFPQNMSREIAAIAAKVGLHIFKHEKRFLHLTGIRPAPISSDLGRFSLGVRKVVELLRSTSGLTRRKLLDLVLARSTASTEEEKESVKATLAADLRWLIAVGHVIEFSGGMLHLVEPRAGSTANPRQKRQPRNLPSPQRKETPRSETSAQARSEAQGSSAATPQNQSIATHQSPDPGALDFPGDREHLDTGGGDHDTRDGSLDSHPIDPDRHEPEVFAHADGAPPPEDLAQSRDSIPDDCPAPTSEIARAASDVWVAAAEPAIPIHSVEPAETVTATSEANWASDSIDESRSQS